MLVVQVIPLSFPQSYPPSLQFMIISAVVGLSEQRERDQQLTLSFYTNSSPELVQSYSALQFFRDVRSGNVCSW